MKSKSINFICIDNITKPCPEAISVLYEFKQDQDAYINLWENPKVPIVSKIDFKNNSPQTCICILHLKNLEPIITEVPGNITNKNKVPKQVAAFQTCRKLSKLFNNCRPPNLSEVQSNETHSQSLSKKSTNSAPKRKKIDQSLPKLDDEVQLIRSPIQEEPETKKIRADPKIEEQQPVPKSYSSSATQTTIPDNNILLKKSATDVLTITPVRSTEYVISPINITEIIFESTNDSSCQTDNTIDLLRENPETVDPIASPAPSDILPVTSKNEANEDMDITLSENPDSEQCYDQKLEVFQESMTPIQNMTPTTSLSRDQMSPIIIKNEIKKDYPEPKIVTNNIDNKNNSNKEDQTDSKTKNFIKNAVLIQGICLDYDQSKLLGSGGFGKVYKAFDQNNNNTSKTVALKISNDDPNSRHMAQVEAAIQRFCYDTDGGSKFFCKIFDCFPHEFKNTNPNENLLSNKTTKPSYCISMEMASGSNLESRYFIPKIVPKFEALKKITLQIAEALNFLHSIGIAHADIKPDNIVFMNKDENCHKLKLIDFGAATPMEDQIVNKINDRYRSNLQKGKTRIVGIRNFCAPESFLALDWDTSVDMWALGCILYQLCTGHSFMPEQPDDQDQYKMVERIKNDYQKFKEQKQKQQFWQNARNKFGNNNNSSFGKYDKVLDRLSEDYGRDLARNQQDLFNFSTTKRDLNYINNFYVMYNRNLDAETDYMKIQRKYYQSDMINYGTRLRRGRAEKLGISNSNNHNLDDQNLLQLDDYGWDFIFDKHHNTNFPYWYLKRSANWPDRSHCRMSSAVFQYFGRESQEYKNETRPLNIHLDLVTGKCNALSLDKLNKLYMDPADFSRRYLEKAYQIQTPPQQISRPNSGFGDFQNFSRPGDQGFSDFHTLSNFCNGNGQIKNYQNNNNTSNANNHETKSLAQKSTSVYLKAIKSMLILHPKKRMTAKELIKLIENYQEKEIRPSFARLPESRRRENDVLDDIPLEFG